MGDAPIRFTDDDLARFAVASRDVNPLHTDASYARRTPFGERVVYGALGGLAAMARLRPRAGRALAKLTLEFAGPIFVGVDYAVEVDDDGADRAKVRVRDGRRVVLRATARFRDGDPDDASGDSGSHLAAAAARETSSLTEGLSVEGRYAAEPRALAEISGAYGLRARGVGRAQVEAVMACSYVVGMELPGESALFSDVTLDFVDGTRPPGPLAWSARVEAARPELGVLSLRATLAGVASAKLTAFAREPLRAPAISGRRGDALKGKVALVTGASRGLGASLARALCAEGCAVVGTYQHSRDEAEALGATLGADFVAMRGDAADPEWAARAREMVTRRFGGLDLLVCNACPPLRPLWLEPASAARVEQHVTRAVAMVNTPMAHLLDLVAARGGAAVVVSSAAVDEPPGEWPHYVAAKCAIEGLARVAAVEYPAARVAVLRPPKLLTQLVNTPMGRHGAEDPDAYAARVVRALLARAPGAGLVLDA
ncbi:MAG: SDR family NAD(P)-dependent oxidoreductase [Polyangiales bacterium]